VANKYVRSGAGGAGTGADWTNAYVTLTAAIAGSAAGDDIWVAADHAESTAGAVSLVFPGSSASPNRVICAIHTGTVPPVSADLRTTATVSTTGANAITIRGNTYIYGIIFNAGSAANSASLSIGGVGSAITTMVSCGLVLNNTNAASRIRIESPGNTSHSVLLRNTTMTFGSTSQRCLVNATRWRWENTASAIAGATIPTTLFDMDTGNVTTTTLHGVDLSALTSGTGSTIFGFAANQPALNILQDCKLGSGVTVAATPTANYASETFVIRSNSGAVSYTTELYAGLGTETVETTIVRTGGFAVNGTTIAKKYVTGANAKQHKPFAAIPIAVANSTTGSNRTVTVYGVWGGGAVPTNADIWFDVYYLGSASTPQATVVTNGKDDVLATATNQTADASSTWGGSTTKFKMTVTLSSPQPQLAGEMYVRIYCGAASSTFYVCPKVELS
jgi:hypothetical protein